MENCDAIVITKTRKKKRKRMKMMKKAKLTMMISSRRGNVISAGLICDGC